MVLSANLTRRALSLGARDDKTGWCAKQWTETTIKGILLEAGQSVRMGDFGYTARYPHTLLSPSAVVEDDEVKDANNKYYHVESVKQLWTLDRFDGYASNLVKVDPHYDREATSGTWHTDSDSIVTDVRNRMKTWLDYPTWLPTIYEDNGSTAASRIVMFAKPDYSWWREFVTNSVDAIAYVEQVDCKARTTPDKYPYAFDESASIRICAVNKTGITGTRLVEAFEQAIRKVATDHPTGSIRTIDSIQNKDEDLGGITLFSRSITIKYARANDDYVPTYPRITYGSGNDYFIFPNVISMPEQGENKDAWLDLPGYSGTFPQGLGSKSIDIEIVSDLDMEPKRTTVSTGLTWRRPQTTQSKTDNANWDVFRDLLHNEGKDQPYHLLTFAAPASGVGGPSFAVRLVSYRVDPTGEGNQLHVIFREDRETTAAALTYKQRLGIT